MKQIFIVEDDRGIRELLELLLTNANYLINSFSTAEAFKRLIAFQQPDLILMDIMLPDGNGMDLCKYLGKKKETNNIPVVLMSAHADIKVLEEKHVTDFIAKPFDIDELLFKVQRQLG